MNIHGHGSKDFKCDYLNCNQKYYLKNHLERHKKWIHGLHNSILDRSFGCEFCIKKYVSQVSLTRHLFNTHHYTIPKLPKPYNSP